MVFVNSNALIGCGRRPLFINPYGNPGTENRKTGDGECDCVNFIQSKNKEQSDRQEIQKGER